MDGNKDEALKCFKIGRDAFDAGDRSRALKFITKARRLDPSLPIHELLSKLQEEPTNESSPASTKVTDNTTNTNSGARRRVSPSGSSSSSSSTTSVAYTEEQISIVREIKRKKDYYEILGLEKGCSVDDVRKAYRKLSLKVHPDKNTAPGAEEAFKSVSKAFQCLSDEESRKRYDLVGSEEPMYERRATRRQGQGFHGLYEADIDADEIFRNFFGGMNPAMSAQFGTFSFGPGMGVRMHNNGSSPGWVRNLIQLLPVLLILLLSFMPSSDPIYALYRSYPYEHRFTTQKDVNFYVKSAARFEQDYPPNSPERVRLEGQVERDYVSVLTHNCRLELQRFQWGLVRETPHCDSLKQFQMVT